VTNNPQVTEFLRKEILRKNEKIASLEAILEQREILVEQEKAAFIKHAEQKVNGAEIESRSFVAQAHATMNV
jgi:hypothetical protein